MHVIPKWAAKCLMTRVSWRPTWKDASSRKILSFSSFQWNVECISFAIKYLIKAPATPFGQYPHSKDTSNPGISDVVSSFETFAWPRTHGKKYIISSSSSKGAAILNLSSIFPNWLAVISPLGWNMAQLALTFSKSLTEKMPPFLNFSFFEWPTLSKVNVETINSVTLSNKNWGWTITTFSSSLNGK